MLFPVAKCLVSSVVVLFVGAFAASTQAADQSERSASNLDSLSIAQLFERLDSAPRVSDDPTLCEIVRRAGPEVELAFEEALRRRLKSLEIAERELDALKSDTDAWRNQYAVVDRLQCNLEFLTAFRRSQKRPDPLVVEVLLTKDVVAWSRYRFSLREQSDLEIAETLEVLNEKLRKAQKELAEAENRLDSMAKEKDGAAWKAQNAAVQRAKQTVASLKLRASVRRSIEELAPLATEFSIPNDMTATTRELPTFVVKLTSADVDKHPLWIMQGGDYRTGREARWRFEVKNAAGEILPVRPEDAMSMMGGGAFQQDALEHGETWATVLPMGSFVDIPKTGDYTVSVLYHNSITIADITNPEELNELIVFRSKPFKLRIEKGPRRVVQLEDGSRAMAKSLIAVLPAKGTINIVCGEYDKSFHRFMSPDSPPGQLLQMRWQAVPELLEALNGEHLTAHQIAWVLSLLYTITGEQDLSPMKHYEAFPNIQWQSSPACYGSVGNRSISLARRNLLIGKWVELQREYLDIRESTPVN